jgi:hypothetical protein
MTQNDNPTIYHSIDWDAVTREAADILSRYVRIDSSHPRGRTVETAAMFAELLAAEGVYARLYRMQYAAERAAA